ncbi:MAG: hypothetical protein LBK83_01330 [Treponema sp.]|nr:hypothetical protein [Treponema sp.]
MMNLTAKIEMKTHKWIGITTSLNGFAKSLMKNKAWKLIRAGHSGLNRYNKRAPESTSSNRNTYSFRWVGDQ